MTRTPTRHTTTVPTCGVWASLLWRWQSLSLLYATCTPWELSSSSRGTLHPDSNPGLAIFFICLVLNNGDPFVLVSSAQSRAFWEIESLIWPIWMCYDQWPYLLKIQEVELKIQDLYRNRPGQGLPPATLHGPITQTPVREGDSNWETSAHSHEGSYRQNEETQGTYLIHILIDFGQILRNILF